jgi:hypothetical protein
VINSENPVGDVVLPKGKPAGESHAYSLKKITQMLKVLPEPASTIVAVAAFTGVCKGELRGFLWKELRRRAGTDLPVFPEGHALEPRLAKAKRQFQSLCNWRDC